MTLHEAETKLAEINNSLAELLKEREKALKEWNIAFNTENPDEITCIAEGIGINRDTAFNLYLINGDSKILVCHIYDDYKECGIQDFYEKIDNEMHLLSVANGRGYEVPELHRNLVHAKAMEIRERAREALLLSLMHENVPIEL